MAEKGKNRGKILLIAVIAVSVIAVAIGTGVVEIPEFIEGPPGDAPRVTYETDIDLIRNLWAPTIDSVSTEKTSRSYSEIAEEKYEVSPQLVGWKGTVELTINYPNSPTPRTKSQDFQIGVYDEIHVPFTWTSRQYGEHTLTIKVFDEEGTLVDSTTDTVSR